MDSATRRRQAGSFIIEALVSLLIFMVGLLALIGLVGQSLNQVGQSKARNDASYLAGELISEMWVNSSVNITTWGTRVQALIPGATATVYFATCDCIAATCAAGNAKTGAQTIADRQVATVCISWPDKKNPADPHMYQTSTMISRN